MSKYALRRLIQMIPVVLGVTFLIYALVYALPGDPTAGKCGERPCSPAYVAEFRKTYNLNDPLPLQYVKYLGNVVQGDLGESQYGQPIRDELAERFGTTFKLGVVALVFEVVVGLLAGVLAALRRGGFLDNLVLVSTLFVIAIPVFVTGRALQLYLGVRAGLFPATVSFEPTWFELLLPGFVLGSTSLAYLARLMRTNLGDNLSADYVRTAHAKGLSTRRVVGVHALRNSMIPVVTFIGYDFGALLGGAIITEGIFNVPGVGQYVFRAINDRDGQVVVGTVTALVLVYLVANLVVDLLYAYLDPRISHD
ncbi:ABC transporter permease [Marmoricola sp. Leaf446]|uniref:ABC transporter permease n=1 Tax=Marmoricola sp. Leaf446 TaxID=1736379 RepID=UPI0006F99C15|nr:ABC transporter permease [Marmoricola sp. Leaf446]KQT94518.1 ABC transporter permease [Marmoricola sp. Leaf446]